MGVAGALDQHFAALRRTDSGQHREQGRFAGTVAPQNGEALASVQLHVEITTEDSLADAHAQSTGFEQGKRVVVGHFSASDANRAPAG